MVTGSTLLHPAFAFDLPMAWRATCGMPLRNLGA